MAPRLTKVQKQMIAHRLVHGASVADLASDYGRTVPSMHALLRSAEMKDYVARYGREIGRVVDQARAYLGLNALEIAKSLVDDAQHRDPDVRRWAAPLALQYSLGAPGAELTVHHEHTGKVKHDHEGGQGDGSLSPIVTGLLDAVRSLREANPVIDIEASPHVLSAEAARPRPAGYIPTVTGAAEPGSFRAPVERSLNEHLRREDP